MQRFSIGIRLMRRWMPLVAALVFADLAVKDEQTANTLNAFTYCLDKSR